MSRLVHDLQSSRPPPTTATTATESDIKSLVNCLCVCDASEVCMSQWVDWSMTFRVLVLPPPLPLPVPMVGRRRWCLLNLKTRWELSTVSSVSCSRRQHLTSGTSRSHSALTSPFSSPVRGVNTSETLQLVGRTVLFLVDLLCVVLTDTDRSTNWM